MQSVTVSAPGKVLIVGGYMILDPDKRGVALASNARFFSSLSLHTLQKNIHHPDNTKLIIQVKSPQFHQLWLYGLLENTKDECSTSYTLQPLIHGQQYNQYIEKTILCVSMALKGLESKIFELKLEEIKDKNMCLEIILQADNDFYSQRYHADKTNSKVTRATLSSLPQFIPCPLDDNGQVIVIKTGMGSSAALISSLVGGLMCFFLGEKIPSRTSSLNEQYPIIKKIHHLAQICHCYAQGKIGSGFDVSAAIYGSQIYSRFSTNIIKDLLNNPINPKAISKCIEDRDGEWNIQTESFELPRGFGIIMGDICGGSETVSMVKKVLEWKEEEQKKANDLWFLLNKKNEMIISLFHRLREEMKDENSNNIISTLKNLKHDQWVGQGSSIAMCLHQIRKCFLEIRGILKQIGTESLVPIEPDDQTILADATMELKGVLIAGVPGAGGRDAIFAILIDETISEIVEEFWLNWENLSSNSNVEMSISPLLHGMAPTGFLGGILMENKFT